ncbi:choice-of-anchor H family protein [Kangiella sp. TOML190]|uniref:choice-of-anchor H family protein n=1 Tax=Kangiella sp. TOML190 TaxID=2931351 RepID=UPI0020416B23|nr:choice-of-anchor H family protein [Kangiella sp. TOML190]
MKFQKRLLSVAVISALALSTPVAVDASETQVQEPNKVRIGQKLITSNKAGQEGKQNSTATKLEDSSQSRQAEYKNQQSGEDLVGQFKAQQLSKGLMVNGKLVPSKQRNSEKSTKAGHLYIYDSAVLLKTDEDSDGYYSEIRVDFDVDASYNDYYDVYAELFIREEGSSQWTHYYTTEVFEIYGADNDDDYHVTTTFNDGFPSGYYEVAIDLFEHGYSGIVDSTDAIEDPDLGNLPIEDTSYEYFTPETDVSISTVKTEIFTDDDNDGYYRDFKISFDADTTLTSRDVVAKLYQKSAAGDWQYETESEVYTINGTSTDDTIAFEATWQAGYATNYYDFKIEIVDPATNELLAEASNDFGPLVDVPLEDAGKDTASGGSGSGGSGSGSGGGVSTSSSGSGGGSWGLLGVLLLGAFGWLRRKT